MCGVPLCVWSPHTKGTKCCEMMCAGSHNLTSHGDEITINIDYISQNVRIILLSVYDFFPLQSLYFYSPSFRLVSEEVKFIPTVQTTKRLREYNHYIDIRMFIVVILQVWSSQGFDDPSINPPETSDVVTLSVFFFQLDGQP